MQFLNNTYEEDAIEDADADSHHHPHLAASRTSGGGLGAQHGPLPLVVSGRTDALSNYQPPYVGMAGAPVTPPPRRVTFGPITIVPITPRQSQSLTPSSLSSQDPSLTELHPLPSALQFAETPTPDDWSSEKDLLSGGAASSQPLFPTAVPVTCVHSEAAAHIIKDKPQTSAILQRPLFLDPTDLDSWLPKGEPVAPPPPPVAAAAAAALPSLQREPVTPSHATQQQQQQPHAHGPIESTPLPPPRDHVPTSFSQYEVFSDDLALRNGAPDPDRHSPRRPRRPAGNAPCEKPVVDPFHSKMENPWTLSRRCDPAERDALVAVPVPEGGAAAGSKRPRSSSVLETTASNEAIWLDDSEVATTAEKKSTRQPSEEILENPLQSVDKAPSLIGAIPSGGTGGGFSVLCDLCRSAEITCGSGMLCCPVPEGSSIPPLNTLFLTVGTSNNSSSGVFVVHIQCALWAPEVFWSEGDKCWKGIPEAIERAMQIKCASCRLPGASIGCHSAECQRSYHLPCALASKRLTMDEEAFTLFCHRHRPASFQAHPDRHLEDS